MLYSVTVCYKYYQSFIICACYWYYQSFIICACYWYYQSFIICACYRYYQSFIICACYRYYQSFIICACYRYYQSFIICACSPVHGMQWDSLHTQRLQSVHQKIGTVFMESCHQSLHQNASQTEIPRYLLFNFMVILG